MQTFRFHCACKPFGFLLCMVFDVVAVLAPAVARFSCAYFKRPLLKKNIVIMASGIRSFMVSRRYVNDAGVHVTSATCLGVSWGIEIHACLARRSRSRLYGGNLEPIKKVKVSLTKGRKSSKITAAQPFYKFRNKDGEWGNVRPPSYRLAF